MKGLATACHHTFKATALLLAVQAPGLAAAPVPAKALVQAQVSQTSTVAIARASSYQIDIGATKQWLDTNIDLRSGEKLHITATGTITYPGGEEGSKNPARSFGPDGLARGWKDLIHEYAVADGGHGALIGRLGASDAGGQPFAIGAGYDLVAPVPNRLFLGINQSQKDASTATGTFHVKIEVIDPGLSTEAAAVVGGPAETPIAAITMTLLDKIPRRVSDPEGHPGDMVNILILGTEDQLVETFTAAGWVHVDSTVKDTILAGFLDSIEKKDYLTMPMSTLYLFERPQDYGFAHAEPVRSHVAEPPARLEVAV
jgi:hypothetical protein